MKLKQYFYIDSIFKLNEDLQDILITNDVVPKPKFDELDCVKRHLFGAYRRNLFVLEPQCYYYITFKEIDNENDAQNYIEIRKLLQYGLFIAIDFSEKIVHCFNATQNQIFIQQDTVFNI